MKCFLCAHNERYIAHVYTSLGSFPFLWTSFTTGLCTCTCILKDIHKGHSHNLRACHYEKPTASTHIECTRIELQIGMSTCIQNMFLLTQGEVSVTLSASVDLSRSISEFLVPLPTHPSWSTVHTHT